MPQAQRTLWHTPCAAPTGSPTPPHALVRRALLPGTILTAYF
ncbi:hypothetical protein ACQ4WX_50725 [Streptomyces lasalocidi]